MKRGSEGGGREREGEVEGGRGKEEGRRKEGDMKREGGSLKVKRGRRWREILQILYSE